MAAVVLVNNCNSNNSNSTPSNNSSCNNNNCSNNSSNSNGGNQSQKGNGSDDKMSFPVKLNASQSNLSDIKSLEQLEFLCMQMTEQAIN